MNLQQIYDDIGGIHEVAQELDVTIYRLRRWIERRDTTNCPLPVKRLTSTYLYSIEEWRGWFSRWSQTRGFEAINRPTKGFSRRRVVHKDRGAITP